MREIRTSGSEGGGAGNSTGSPYPYHAVAPCGASKGRALVRPLDFRDRHKAVRMGPSVFRMSPLDFRHRPLVLRLCPRAQPPVVSPPISESTMPVMKEESASLARKT